MAGPIHATQGIRHLARRRRALEVQEYHPTTSTIRSTYPEALASSIAPSGPSCTITRLVEVVPGPVLRSLVTCQLVACGNTAMKLAAVTSVAVTLTATVRAPVAGTPAD